MNLVALQARPQKMRYALSNGFGFGGVLFFIYSSSRAKAATAKIPRQPSPGGS
jgi:hypothetical protein